MKKILLIFLISIKPLIAQYNLETCTTDIANDVPEFFKKYFHCVKARMSSSGEYINIYFNGLPPYSTWYYEQGHPNDIEYSAPGSPMCQPGPPSGDCYFQVPNDLVEGDWVISVPFNPQPIDGVLKMQNSVNGIQDGNDANEYPMGTIGVALNGVHIHNPLAAGDDVIEDEKYGFDLYNAHPDFGNSYHYHSTSMGPLEVLSHKLPNHVTNSIPGSAEIELYGITCDGTIIMGCTELNKNSVNFSELDCQNGHVHDIVDENGTTLISNRYHTHICYTDYTDNDNTGNNCQDHEFTPESSYYISTSSNPNNNVCGASSQPIEGDSDDILGCVDVLACNYNINANIDNGSCIFPEVNFDCDGNCILEIDCAGICGGSGIDNNNDGVCDELSIDHLLNPEQFTITKIHPNPFNPTTAIHFSLSYMTKVKLSIYNLKGQELYTLINKVMSKGEHVVKWNADSFSSGVYFVKMTSANNKSIKKILLIK